MNRIIWLAALTSLVSSSAHATSIALESTRDTFITQNAALGGPASTHRGDSMLWAGGASNLKSVPLVYFDLRTYRGAIVTGTPQFTLWIDGGALSGDGTARDIGIYSPATAWDENSVTWNNFGNVATGPLLSTQTGIVWPGTGERAISFDIPAAVLQTWIDQPGPTFPASNPGLLVRNLSDSADRDVRFSSRDGDHAPRLTFDVASRVGDFNNDGQLRGNDIDLLFAQPSGSVPPGDPLFDLNGDGSIITVPNVPHSDADVWVDSANSLYGDADLDGRVIFDDLLILAKNYGNSLGWQQGNFDGQNGVDFADLLLLAQNYNQSAVDLSALPEAFAAEWTRALSIVPEPTAAMGLATGLLFLRRRSR